MEALVNSLGEVYDIINIQLSVVSHRTKNKHDNPDGWKLDAKGAAEQKLFEQSQKPLGERFEIEAPDIPLFIHKTLADNEAQIAPNRPKPQNMASEAS